jgi:protein SCO1/2
MMKKFISSTYIVVACIILVPLLAFEAVRLLQNNYERLPVLNQANDLLSTDYHFESQHKQFKTFDDWKNKILVVDFFFTVCPTICPKMVASLSNVATAINNDEKVQLLSFTVDPVNDSATKLLNYAERMKCNYPNWDFLTGDKKAIYKLARKEFFVTATDGDGGPQDFIHSDKIILIDTHNNIRGYYDGTSVNEIKLLINDIKKLEHEN